MVASHTGTQDQSRPPTITIALKRNAQSLARSKRVASARYAYTSQTQPPAKAICSASQAWSSSTGTLLRSTHPRLSAPTMIRKADGENSLLAPETRSSNTDAASGGCACAAASGGMFSETDAVLMISTVPFWRLRAPLQIRDRFSPSYGDFSASHM